MERCLRGEPGTLGWDHAAHGIAMTSACSGARREPKVVESMSLGQSVLFKLRRRASENTNSEIRLEHVDLLVMDGFTQFDHKHCWFLGIASRSFGHLGTLSPAH